MPDPRPLWDPARERAALLTPGTRVRFVTADAAADGTGTGSAAAQATSPEAGA